MLPILSPFHDLYRYWRDRREANRLYERYFSRKINWKHPTEYNEKLQIFKISKEAENLWPYVDKYEVRKHVEKVIGKKYLNTLYGVYDSVEEINIDELPDQFVLKTTHGSGWNIICKDKKKLNWKKAKADLRKWMKMNYYYQFGNERQYKKIKPRIICEKYLDMEKDGLLDVKIFSYAGKPIFFNMIKDKLSKMPRKGFYDTDWKKLPIICTGRHKKIQMNKPKNYQELYDLAAKLSRPFKQVRVDLLVLNNKIYFGELTFTSSNGIRVFEPAEYDRKFGEHFHL